MEHKDLTSSFNAGNLYLLAKNEKNEAKPWNAHPKFRGVYLKNIITGNQTEGVFSTHLVKVENGCSIGEHIHENNTELHEILKGTGTCMIGSIEVSYSPGDCAVIPQGTLHEVVAGENGLFLFAKFFPALV